MELRTKMRYRELLRSCNLPIPPVCCGVLVTWLVHHGLSHVPSINVKTPELADSPLRAQTLLKHPEPAWTVAPIQPRTPTKYFDIAQIDRVTLL